MADYFFLVQSGEFFVFFVYVLEVDTGGALLDFMPSIHLQFSKVFIMPIERQMECF